MSTSPDTPDRSTKTPPLAPPRAPLSDRTDLTLEELVADAAKLLQTLVPAQTSYRVTETPDARTIRYYVTQRLLPRPLSYDGGRARYGPSHLLRLLWIKKLQSEHFTLRQIRERLADVSDDDLRVRLWPDTADAANAPPAEATATEATVPTTSALISRFTLDGGGSVDLPTARLDSPQARAAVARALQRLAQHLAATSAQSPQDRSLGTKDPT
ncbi:MAG: MerR family transcriptional regulator [Deltaproteobacteria bacterium]|nr:MerR family transcriptional regulator [Deltaproteobacteria bacterium]